MSYAKSAPTKPATFIARRRYGTGRTGLAGVWDAITVGLTGGAQVITAARGDSPSSGGAPVAPADSGFPWLPVLAVGGVVVVGAVLIKRSRK